jgi:hypothetical protein
MSEEEMVLLLDELDKKDAELAELKALNAELLAALKAENACLESSNGGYCEHSKNAKALIARAERK